MWEAIKSGIFEIIKGVIFSVVDNSYWICLIVCLLALIFYISGQKKAGKYVSISFVTYFLLQCLKLVIE